MATRTKNIMMGRYYTFFLNNKDLSTWYLYRIFSPCASDVDYPMVSLTKVGERTGTRDFQVKEKKGSAMKSCDLISTILGKEGSVEDYIDFIQNQVINGIEGSHNPTLKKFPPDIIAEKGDMPAWEIMPGTENYLTKLTIIELRDKLRWSKYKFIPGNFIDLMITPSKFGLLEIMGDKNEMWLEPRGIFLNSDPNMMNKIDKPFVAFTLDDGYLDNYTTAYPIFKRNHIPFCIFVATDFPDRKAILWWITIEDLILSNEKIELSDGSTYICKTYQQKWDTFRLIREKILKLDKGRLLISLQELFSSYNIDWLEPIQEMGMTWDNIKELGEGTFDKETRIQIATVQSLVRRILNEDETGRKLTVSDYDLMSVIIIRRIPIVILYRLNSI